MKIKQVIETPEGTFTFEGELNEVEHDLIVEAGVNYLLKEGVLPFRAATKAVDKVSYSPQEGSGTEQ